MAEGSFPDLAAREVDVDDVSAVPMAAGSSGEAALIVTARISASVR